MENIVIWGCGKYGKYYYNHFTQYWSKSINVIGFVDANYDEFGFGMKNEEKFCENTNEDTWRVYSPCELKNLYKKNVISRVFIGTSEIYYDSIKKCLDRMNIPIWDFPIPRMKSIYPSVNVSSLVQKDGENVNIYVGDLYMLCDGGIPNIRRHSVFWIFNSEKEVFEESFNYLDIKQWKENFIQYYEFDSEKENIIELDEKICILARTYTEANYAHFLYEVLDKVIFMERHDYDGRYIIACKKEYYKLYKDILELMNIDIRRIVFLDPIEDNGKLFHSKQMYIFPSANIHNNMLLEDNMMWLYEKISAKIQQECMDKKETYPKRLFVKRIGSRKLLSYENVISKYNFTTIIPEKLSIYEQIKYYYNAEIVISPHGANCSNILFMKENTSFIECFDSGYVSDFFWDIVKFKKLKYQMLVCPNQYENYIEQRDTNMDYIIPENIFIRAIENAIEMQGFRKSNNDL